ncbi:TonB-dependent receptor [Caulobacter sp. KR2-114]|uniref:TonB-dependent receptor n=1 Tax=Caulobacter sp. KR2-114 TaxID=3400912 RepID=UPI003C089B50
MSMLAGASCLALGAGWPAIAAAQAQAPIQANAPAAAGGDTAVGELIVTASRRSESIVKVPTAISAYSGSKLAEHQVASLGDLTAATPNLQISSSGTSVDINIRGIGNGNLNQAGGEPGVAVQFDGVYLGQAGLAVTTLLDVSRVEILRGPQGTLFGRNATGGAINIIPNTPTRALSYGADLSVGFDPAMARSSAYVSGPLDASGALTGRLSVEQDYNHGYTRNLAPGAPGRLDGIDDGAVRGQLEWRPTADLDVRLLAEYQRESDPGPAVFLLGTPGNTALPAPMQGFAIGDPASRQAYANIAAKSLEAGTIDLNVDWRVAGGDLKGLVSYNTSRQHFWQDGDGSLADFTSTLYADWAHQTYVELIYASDPSRPFSYVLGANYYDENFRQNIQVPDVELPFTFSEGGTVRTRSYAVFAHAQYALTREAKLFGGVRYTNDRKSIVEFNNFVGAGAQSASWSHVTYEVGLSYDVTPTVTGYAKYATGYKSGGFSAGSLAAPFNPETNANYEVGLKGRLLDGRVQGSLSAFHMDYGNLQVNQIVGYSAAITNAARAKIDGVELETVLRPASHLRLEVSASWLNARFDAFQTADSARPSLGTLDLAGHALPGAPHYTASIGAYYEIPLADGGAVTPGVQYDWKSRLYFSEFNLPISSQATAGKLNLFVNYKSPDGRWMASVFALNAADAHVRSNVLVVSALLGSLALAQYQPGRQVGVSVGYHF